jgi:hypothetical protein
MTDDASESKHTTARMHERHGARVFPHRLRMCACFNTCRKDCAQAFQGSPGSFLALPILSSRSFSRFARDKFPPGHSPAWSFLYRGFVSRSALSGFNSGLPGE